MRHLPEVIQSLLLIVPETEDLHTILQSRLSSTRYASPEIMPSWWAMVASDLGYHIGEERPTTGWQKKVADIWSGGKTSE